MHDLIQITEEKLLEAIEIAERIDGQKASGLAAALDKGNLYIAADLTPFYAYDPINGSIFVTSEEAMDGRFDA